MPPWYAWALEQYRQFGGPQGVPIALVRHYRDLGGVTDGETESDRLIRYWCSIFANAALAQSGMPSVGSAEPIWFERHPGFVRLDKPVVGAIALYWRRDPRSDLRHVAFYQDETDDAVIGLGGCQRGGINPADLPRKGEGFGFDGCWWPRDYPMVRQ